MAEPDHTSARRPVGAEWLCVGVISGPHGVKGDVRLKSFTADPMAIGAYKALALGVDGEPVRILHLRPGKGELIGRIEGVSTRDAAEALKGRELYLHRRELPPPAEDEFYIADLEGLEAVDGDGRRLGVIRTVHDYGAGPMIEVVLDESRKGVGRSPVLPFTSAWVPEIDLREGRVVVLLDAWLTDQVPDEATGSAPEKKD